VLDRCVALCVGNVLTCTSTSLDGDAFQTAVCAEHVMVAGTHYVELTLVENKVDVLMGLVGPDLPSTRRESFEGWMLYCTNGTLCHRVGKSSKTIIWNKQPRPGEIKPGDVIGLLLDLGQRTLSVYLNGARRGVMVAPGMKDHRGDVVVSLAGPLCWSAFVGVGSAVRIEHRPAPPSPTAEEVAAAVAWTHGFDDFFGNEFLQ
jgi:hypothetical protein